MSPFPPFSLIVHEHNDVETLLSTSLPDSDLSKAMRNRAAHFIERNQRNKYGFFDCGYRNGVTFEDPDTIVNRLVNADNIGPRLVAEVVNFAQVQTTVTPERLAAINANLAFVAVDARQLTAV